MRTVALAVVLVVTAGVSAQQPQQIDSYIRSLQQSPKNRPNREVFMHFFGMEVTWK